MVNRGVPSKACGLCRTRKIKCDQSRPACSQCIRVRAECPGYRNPFDLLFRDETRKVEEKSRSAAAAGTFGSTNAQPVAIMAIPSSPAIFLASRPSKQNLLHSISPTATELVLPLFFNYFTVDDTASGHSLLSFLPPKLSTAPDDPLSAAVLAVGYSILANVTRSPDRLNLARQQYATAVRTTCTAIEKSSPPQSCEVVRVILMLALYEALSCRDSQSINLWSKHLQGAATIYQVQGVDMPNCVLGNKGAKLLLELQSQTISNCLQRKLPVPVVLSELYDSAEVYMPSDELHRLTLGKILIRLANLQAGLAQDISPDPTQAIKILIEIDRDLDKWVLDTPSTWNPKVRPCVPGGFFYTNSFHHYLGFSIATTWNRYRLAGCLLKDMILKFQDPIADPCLVSPNYCHQAKRHIKELCDEICSSVPYIVGQKSPYDATRPNVGAFEVMWPLFVCTKMSCIPEEQRSWAATQLERIGHESGVRQAIPLAALAKQQTNTSSSHLYLDPTWRDFKLIHT
ncbi:hypothetical protein BT63DRAFT_201125 [Microthyrium microscopicum]|uniref:Zn(2)-C6 fungal-type domain-containing protein n=1 Tax=Microthyrium microscopicum TaxID=703497 RepID=A0A6A6UG44_9PEZI|nr:hypothetical protein BT63DRAFT_201125 [Microthyrium microscopicum]